MTSTSSVRKDIGVAWERSAVGDAVEFNSRHVNAEIKRKVWPVLRACGFDKFNARNRWKHNPDSIAVVNFQSFSASHAARRKCTTFSFCINLGVYYPCVHDTPWADRWPVLYRACPTEPPEHGCHARHHLGKRIRQTEYPDPGIWYVRPDGSNLGETIDDAVSVIADVGVPWLEKFTNPRYALTQYQLPREIGREEYVCAFGTLKAAAEGSAVAFALKDFGAAESLWRAILDSARYARFPEIMEQARAILSIISDARHVNPVDGAFGA